MYQITVERNDLWVTDARHLNWMLNIIMRWPFRQTLEIGCWKGESSKVFVEAIRQGHQLHANFCDICITEGVRNVLNGVPRCVVHEALSTELLRSPKEFDFVFVDGNHSLKEVSEETRLLLIRRPLCVMAHDTTSCIAGYPGCEGPQYLKRSFMTAQGYYCLEDAQLRIGECTQRGMFFATRDRDLYGMAQQMLAHWGGLESA